MIPLGFVVKYTGPVPRHILKEHRRVLTDGYRAIARQWHGEYRGEHFKPGATARYGYRLRAGEGQSGKRFWRSYSGRKRKKFGHQRPLVYTGESERATQIARIVANSRGSRVVMRAPALNFRPRGWTYTLREELTRVTLRELRLLTVGMQRDLNASLMRMQTTTRVQIRRF